MNDIEFALRVSPQVGELYREAKRSRDAFPKHALIQTRALASLCCDLLGAPLSPSWPSGLDDKIGDLARRRRINLNTRDLLHRLRRWGNAAAHPEVSLLDDDRFAALGCEALADALVLLGIVFRELHQGAAIPAYEVVEEQPDQLREICYRALIEGSAPDQHQVAMHLVDDIADRLERARGKQGSVADTVSAQLEIDVLRERAFSLLGHASAAGYAPANYEYGLALIEGARGRDQVPAGVHHIALACRDGYIDALVWCGHAALYGEHGYEVDHDLARSYLERAAADDHPTALTLLSRMYRLGQGVDKDPAAAFAMTLRAAQAGFPVAQFEAAQALLAGGAVPVDEAAAVAWLKQAGDAGLAEAQLALARLIRCGQIDGAALDVERLLLAALPKLNEARLELAEVLAGSDDFTRMTQAAYLYQECYATALQDGDQLLMSRCRAEPPALVKRLERIRADLSDADFKELLMVRFMFDRGGHPYPDRLARARLFFETTIALSKAKGTDRREEARLADLLASGMRSGPAHPA